MFEWRCHLRPGRTRFCGFPRLARGKMVSLSVLRVAGRRIRAFPEGRRSAERRGPVLI